MKFNSLQDYWTSFSFSYLLGWRIVQGKLAPWELLKGGSLKWQCARTLKIGKPLIKS
jgi:hypothetical protein